MFKCIEIDEVICADSPEELAYDYNSIADLYEALGDEEMAREYMAKAKELKGE